MKNFLNRCACAWPLAYGAILRWRGKPNLTKQIFLSLIRRGDVVFDVGAHEGHYTLLFSHLVGRKGAVHAFEPVPESFRKLRDTTGRRGHFANLTLNQTAVGAEDGRVEISIPGSDRAQASMRPHQAGSWGNASARETIETPLTSIESYCRRRPIGRLDFIKLDVEGAELPVLRGAGNVLQKMRPIIFTEVCASWTADFGYRPADLGSFLQSQGYDLFYLVDASIRRLEDLGRELDGAVLPPSVDLLCLEAARHRALSERLRPCIRDGV